MTATTTTAGIGAPEAGTDADLSAPDVAAFAWVGAFVDELARAGVHDACVAPGSRSTPLALALAHHESMRVWMHVDERSAALLRARHGEGRRAPGGAGLHLGHRGRQLPPRGGRGASRRRAADRAHRRPPARAARDVGAPQTIDQLRLYGTHAKWFVDAPLPEATPALLRQVRTLGARAAAAARERAGGPGAPQLPLPRAAGAAAGAGAVVVGRRVAPGLDRPARREPWLRLDGAPRTMDAATLDALAAAARRRRAAGDRLRAARRRRAGRAAGRARPPRWTPRCWPTRSPSSAAAPTTDTLVIDAYDAFLRDDAARDALAPDVVLRFGALPTSKPLLQYWLHRHAAARHVLIVATADWRDPTQARRVGCPRRAGVGSARRWTRRSPGCSATRHPPTPTGRRAGGA